MTCNHKTSTVQACLRAVLDGVPEPTLPHIPRVIIDYITTHQNYRSKGYVHNCQASSCQNFSNELTSQNVHIQARTRHFVDKRLRHNYHASSFIKIQHIHVHIQARHLAHQRRVPDGPGFWYDRYVCTHTHTLSLSLSLSFSCLYIFMYIYLRIYKRRI